MSLQMILLWVVKGELIMRKTLVANDEFFHLRCCANIFNLVVKNGLKDIDISVHKVMKSIKYIKRSFKL